MSFAETGARSGFDTTFYLATATSALGLGSLGASMNRAQLRSQTSMAAAPLGTADVNGMCFAVPHGDTKGGLKALLHSTDRPRALRAS
mmetsp:Transcript_8325/g.16604  ORF Transcript_8325/g.16604 Transcript_8325/m.16604 type:complete len:88 (-) Transcript_8325:1860-2123(-)